MPIPPVTVADTGPDTIGPALQRRLARLREHIRAGHTVWWRRQPIAPAHPPLATHPKWHVFARRTLLDSGTVAWIAPCGHQETESDDPDEQLSFSHIKTRQPFRCARCDELLEQ